jgi:hypothetical protein
VVELFSTVVRRKVSLDARLSAIGPGEMGKRAPKICRKGQVPLWNRTKKLTERCPIGRSKQVSRSRNTFAREVVSYNILRKRLPIRDIISDGLRGYLLEYLYHP